MHPPQVVGNAPRDRRGARRPSQAPEGARAAVGRGQVGCRWREAAWARRGQTFGPAAATMTKDSPSPSGSGHATPKKLATPGPAAAALEEQRRELEKLRAELEAERARGRADRRRFAAEARQLKEAAERERQQLVDHLRSKWEAQRGRELRQLQEEVLREREAEIRQLLRWKEAEMRQLQQLLHRERDGVVRQARELQRQLAEELVNRGYCSRVGAPEVAAAQCRCRLQDVLAQLRWETDGEQASRIRHLQAALDVERQLFLKYILEHFRGHPALSGAADPPVVPSSEEPSHETTAKSPHQLGSLDGGNAGARARSRSLDRVPAACSKSPDSLLPARASSLDSLARAHSCSLGSTLSRPKTPEASSPDTFIPGSPGPPPPPPPSEHRRPGDMREGEESGSKPCEAPSPLPQGEDYRELVKRNSELSEALQVLARHCSVLLEENLQVRRAGFPDEAREKVKRLKVKHAELASLARRLEDRARKLQETNLRAVSAPVPGESLAGLELCQAFARQRSRDLSEQASALLAKDKQIEELRQECHLLQARAASGLGSAPLPGGGAACAEWLSFSDLDRLQRESQREVLRLQRQLTLQQATSSGRAEAGGQSAPCEEARRQVQALELELDARRRECEELGAQAAEARQGREDAEAQLQAALHEGAWLAKENARLQAQADWTRKVVAEDSEVHGQVGRTWQELENGGLLAGQLLQQTAQGQDRQQQLQDDLQKALCDLQAAPEEMRTLQCQPAHPPQEPRKAPQATEPPGRNSRGTKLQSGPEDQTWSPPGRDKQEKEDFLLEKPVAPQEPARDPQEPDREPGSRARDSRPPAKKTSSTSNSSSEVESMWATVPSCPTLDTAREVEDLEPDSVSSTQEVGDSEAPATSKLRIFLARYSYNPFEGPNEHPESELPLTAGEYVFIFGDMDEDGFYEGELEDGRWGLVPSNLVEQIPDPDILGCLPPAFPDLGPTRLLPGQGKALKEDTGKAGKAQGAVDRVPGHMARLGSKTELAREGSGTKTGDGWLGPQRSADEWGFSKPLLGARRVFCVPPMQLRLQSVAATWAEITWVGSNHSHMVYLNDLESALTPAGVSCYTFHHLHPGTRYQAQVEVYLPQESLQGHWETMSSTITFNTPLAGPPDPPLDVLVEHHTSPGLLVVSWLPVTIDSVGSSNGVQVTGYAVYADGLKVAEVTDATAGSTLIECSQLQLPLMCQKVSVRTMSLYGESLDSVPAEIPHSCFPCDRLPKMSPFSYTCRDPSTCAVTFTLCPQRLVLSPLSAKANPYAPGNCGEPQVKSLVAFPEEPQKRRSPMPMLNSEGECPCAGLGSQAQGPADAQGLCRKDLLFQKGPRNHGPPLPRGQEWREESHYQRHMGIKQSPSAGVIQLSPEGGPGKEPFQEKAALDKIPKQMQNAPLPLGTSQQSVPDIYDILREEAGCFGLWGSEGQEQRKVPRRQSRRGLALGGKRERWPQEPSSSLCPALSSKVVRMSRGSAPPLGTRADPTNIFVALSDYDPLGMSASPEAAEEELALRKGQLLRVWCSQDPHGFYRSEHDKQVGNIPGHLAAEVEADIDCTGTRWHLLGQGHPPSGAYLRDLGGLPSPQHSSPRSQERPSLWTPKTMLAALDYDPRDGPAGGSVKGMLSLRAGDVVTVYGPVDDKGFYYGESGGHRGLIPAHLLDDMCFPRE